MKIKPFQRCLDGNFPNAGGAEKDFVVGIGQDVLGSIPNLWVFYQGRADEAVGLGLLPPGRAWRNAGQLPRGPGSSLVVLDSVKPP
jgi:hypothetical protein